MMNISDAVGTVVYDSSGDLWKRHKKEWRRQKLSVPTLKDLDDFCGPLEEISKSTVSK